MRLKNEGVGVRLQFCLRSAPPLLWSSFVLIVRLPLGHDFRAAGSPMAASAAAFGDSGSPVAVHTVVSAVQVVERHLDWDDVVFGASGVSVRGREYPLQSIAWLPGPPAAV